MAGAAAPLRSVFHMAQFPGRSRADATPNVEPGRHAGKDAPDDFPLHFRTRHSVPSTLMQSAPAAGSTPDGQLIELSVEVPEPCPGADLEAAIARRYGTGGLSVRGAPLAAMTVGVPPLVQGAVLVESAVLVDGAAGR